MKRVLSLIAAAMICAVMFVSCGESSSFPKEMQAMEKALQNKDFKGVIANAKVILSAQDKATCNDLISSAISAYMALVGMTQTGEQLDTQEALDLSKKIAAGFEKGKAKDPSFYNQQSEASKAILGGTFDDVLANVKNNWIPTYEAMLNGDPEEDESDYEED